MEQITLHLDPDVARKYQKIAELAGVSFDQAISVILSLKVVNEMPATAEALVDAEVTLGKPAPPADVRSVATDALETLGMIHVEQQKRDAIHLAVEPCVAGEILHPGGHVCLDPVHGGAYSADPTNPNKPGALGIVDPFLDGPVHVGESFWLVVYPRQIRSLRHVWEHPDFPEAT